MRVRVPPPSLAERRICVNPIATIIGWNIQKELKKARMSAGQLSEKIGVTEKTMRNWISGDRQITAYALYRAATVLGCAMEDFMKGITAPERMTVEEAKTIIREDAPDGNVRKRIEAIQLAVRVLGEDCTMKEVWEWAENRK